MRRAGMLVPVWTLRREGDLGIGDTAAMREMIDWAAEWGVGIVQLLPINETGGDPCPYIAISSVALEPAFLALDEVAEITAEDIAAARAAAAPELFTCERVDYAAVKALKRSLLEKGFARFWKDGRSGPRGEDFARFCAEEADWLPNYCKFRVLMDLEGGKESWDLWSINYNTAATAHAWFADLKGMRARKVEKALTYHAWVQWLAFTQWRDLSAYALSRDVKLMGDVPIGISFASADAFFETEWFDLGWSGGAPPERVFKDDAFAVQWGQNWGVPLYRWEDMERDGFTWWRRRLGKFTGIFHAFRIDHILGFYRIYAFPWRPRRNGEFLHLSHEQAAARTGGPLPHFKPNADDTVEHCAENLEHGDRYLRVVLEAAGDCEVVGEDLGAVPPYVRPNLAELGIGGFKICHWEVCADPAGVEHPIPGSEYEECSFATYATHDHPSMAAMWEEFRAGANSQDEVVRAGACWNLRILSEFAGIPVPEDRHSFVPYDDAMKWAMLRALLATRSRYAAFMITDLYGMTDRFNTPATVNAKNWSARMPFTVAEMGTRDDLRKAARRLQSLVKECAR